MSSIGIQKGKKHPWGSVRSNIHIAKPFCVQNFIL